MYKKRLVLVGILLCALFVVSAQDMKVLSFRFFDFPELGELGQKWGDSTLITFPNGEVMLLDSGISRVSEYLVSKIKDMGITHIDRVVLSHLHSDHYGGLSRILDNFSVGEFYWNGFSSLNEKWVIDLFEDRKVPIHTLAAGDSLDIGNVKIEVLYPTREQLDALPIQDSDAAMINMNNNALCIRFEYGENSALFSGDLYKVAEDAVIKAVPADKLDCDLLKINHHGHDTSSGKTWVRATSPEVAVMMGNIVMNLVLYKRYVDVGCTPLATWMNGTIVVRMDGTKLNVQAEKPEIAEYYQKLLALK